MRAALLVGLAGLLASVHPIVAQDPDVGPPSVLVKLQPQGADQPRKIIIGPRGIGVCKQASECGDHFTVMWVGNHNQGEKIRIKFDRLGAAGDCFDRTDFTVDGIGTPNRVTVKVLSNNANCPNKVSFFYTVSCEGGAGGNCGGVAPVDPGAMIDG